MSETTECQHEGTLLDVTEMQHPRIVLACAHCWARFDGGPR